MQTASTASSSTHERILREDDAPFAATGARLDAVLAGLYPEFSRERLKDWIKEGHVSVNGQVVKRPAEKLWGGEKLRLEAEQELAIGDQPEDIPLTLAYEDEQLLVVNKPAGLVVHPAPGHRGGTLVNALLNHDASLANLPRAGIVHRLDKDTSGLLVVARTLFAHTTLVKALAKRKFLREYDALVAGVVVAGGTVEAAIGRDPMARQQMAVIEETGREAVTHYRVVERFREHSHLKLRLETGRTHQIRVHMAHIGFPVLGDPVYAGRQRLLGGASPELRQYLKDFRRQALHASRLGLEHPVSGEMLNWHAPIPEDMARMIELLRTDRTDNAL